MIELNQVTIFGNLCREPDGRRTNSGQSVCTLRIAVNRKTRGDAPDSTVFVDVTTWNKTADFCRDYLRTGSGVVVIGRLDVDEWQDRDGNKRSKLKITADRVQAVDLAKRGETDTGRTQNVPPSSPPAFPSPNKPSPSPPPFPSKEEPAANSPADLGYNDEPVDEIPF